MIHKEDFTPEEWSVLRDTPQIVGLAMMTAGGSGLFGTMKEAITAGTTIFTSARDSSTPVIKELGSQEEMKAFQESFKSELKEAEVGKSREWLRNRALESTGKAVSILEAKASTEEVAAYKAWVQSVAATVASAAKEGGFLGIGGERVSPEERTLMSELNASLGLPGTSASSGAA